MPIVRIEDSVVRTGQEKAATVARLFRVLKAVLGVPDEELQARYIQHAKEDFFAPKGSGGNYIGIEITLFSGRSTNTKRRLYNLITMELSTFLAVDAEDIIIVLNEQPTENWGLHGGVAGCDMDLGYAIAV